MAERTQEARIDALRRANALYRRIIREQDMTIAEKEKTNELQRLRIIELQRENAALREKRHGMESGVHHF